MVHMYLIAAIICNKYYGFVYIKVVVFSADIVDTKEFDLRNRRHPKICSQCIKCHLFGYSFLGRGLFTGPQLKATSIQFMHPRCSTRNSDRISPGVRDFQPLRPSSSRTSRSLTFWFGNDLPRSLALLLGCGRVRCGPRIVC